MRLGVLDVGSNTVHLLIVDACPASALTPLSSYSSELCLAEYLDTAGRISEPGIAALLHAIAGAASAATGGGCEQLLGFATSALREAPNAAAVIEEVRERTGVSLRLLPGEDEAAYTYLAARRWAGYSAGRLVVCDIGGGSMELAAGSGEQAALTASLPLGAARLTRRWFSTDPPTDGQLAALRAYLDEQLAAPARALRRAGPPQRVLGTSKTLRSLAELAADPGAPTTAPRTLTRARLNQITTFITTMSTAELGTLEGISPARARQLLAGAVLAEAVMRALGVERLQTCPWALRHGIILAYLDRPRPHDTNPENDNTSHTLDHGDRTNPPSALPATHTN